MFYMLTAVSVWAAAKPVTSIRDWGTSVCAVDNDGVDDINNNSATDITEFCIAADNDFYYVAMAIDDTRINGSNSDRIGVRIDMNGDQVFDYIVLADITGRSATLKNLMVGSCDGDGVCNFTGNICNGASCEAGLHPIMTGSGNNWPNPFSQPSDKCQGSACETNDTFVEFRIPWQFFPSLDGNGKISGPPTPFFFNEYNAFPSNGEAILIDQQDAQGNGIACYGTSCLSASPSAVELSLLTIESPLTYSFQIWGMFGLLTVFTSGFLLSRRKSAWMI